MNRKKPDTSSPANATIPRDHTHDRPGSQGGAVRGVGMAGSALVFMVRPMLSEASPGVHRSHVWTMAFVKFQPYLKFFGFFDSPATLARTVTGTSTIRACCRSPSMRISDVQN